MNIKLALVYIYIITYQRYCNYHCNYLMWLHVCPNMYFCFYRAVVFIVHGVGEHSGRYVSLAQFLNEHKYAVYSHDHG